MVSSGFDVLMAVVTWDWDARRLESAATQLAKGSHFLLLLTHNVRNVLMRQEGHFWWMRGVRHAAKSRTLQMKSHGIPLKA